VFELVIIRRHIKYSSELDQLFSAFCILQFTLMEFGDVSNGSYREWYVLTADWSVEWSLINDQNVLSYEDICLILVMLKM